MQGRKRGTGIILPDIQNVTLDVRHRLMRFRSVGQAVSLWNNVS
jgi:hypothetical protein